MDMPDDELTGWLEARCERWLLNRTCTTLCAISPTRVREQNTLGKSNTAIGRCPGLCERFSQQEPMDGWMARGWWSILQMGLKIWDLRILEMGGCETGIVAIESLGSNTWSMRVIEKKEK